MGEIGSEKARVLNDVAARRRIVRNGEERDISKHQPLASVPHPCPHFGMRLRFGA